MGIRNISLLAAAACVLAPVTAAVSATGVPTVPIDVWARRDAIASVDISPDGQHLAMLRTDGKEGDEYVLEIYKISDLSKPWRRLAADSMWLRRPGRPSSGSLRSGCPGRAGQRSPRWQSGEQPFRRR